MHLKILFLTHSLPNIYAGNTIRPFYLIKNFKEQYGYDISLISFSDENKNYVKDLKDYCKNILFLPSYDSYNEKKNLFRMIRYLFSFEKIKSCNGMLDPCFYSFRGVQKFVDTYLEANHFDIIYSDASMAGYVANSTLPKIVEPLDINYRNWFNNFKREKRIIKKFYWLIRSLQTAYREMIIFPKFNCCVVVTHGDKKSISKFLKNVIVVPNGVDTDFFKPLKIKEEYPSIIFTGAMDGPKNIETVLYFYNKIYPLIVKDFPKIKFYIVGKNPPTSILNLSNDMTVIVTGFKDDIRPDIAKSSVYICPMISGSGIKNKVLEAMSMGKSIVSTSIGVMGINIVNNHHVIISNEPVEFAKSVILLLNHGELRQNIGENARKLVEDNYSWFTCASEINTAINEILMNRD